LETEKSISDALPFDDLASKLKLELLTPGILRMEFKL